MSIYKKKSRSYYRHIKKETDVLMGIINNNDCCNTISFSQREKRTNSNDRLKLVNYFEYTIDKEQNLPEINNSDHEFCFDNPFDVITYEPSSSCFEESANNASSSQEVMSNLDISNQLRHWAINSNVSHTNLGNLLKILKPHFNKLPLDSRTLLHTPEKLKRYLFTLVNIIILAWDMQFSYY